MRRGGWDMPDRRAPRSKDSYRKLANDLLPDQRYRYYNPDDPHFVETFCRLEPPAPAP